MCGNADDDPSQHDVPRGPAADTALDAITERVENEIARPAADGRYYGNHNIAVHDRAVLLELLKQTGALGDAHVNPNDFTEPERVLLLDIVNQMQDGGFDARAIKAKLTGVDDSDEPWNDEPPDWDPYTQSNLTFDYLDLVMIRDGVELLQPEDPRELERQSNMLALLRLEIAGLRPLDER